MLKVRIGWDDAQRISDSNLRASEVRSAFSDVLCGIRFRFMLN